MGNKEYLQKELDLLLEKLRFWRYVLFAIVSAIIGIIFSISQNKLNVNIIVFGLVLSGFLGIILSIKRLTYLTQEYKEYLKELKDAE
ncbi:hypothetical protein NAMH_0995 [Nautilia profundicola AmH]|uniref:Uncharacterized protein n=1 Tax=Nautilia profundicola (strain ATCC BAA-1463 / DSM 18972 / AmH) TaxID=598659 RepID=B9L9T7_NAUPA|nr:hypothetical protein [Nautilia profundicola]ACM92422.1 hypothetical protein NAMH_0995 [Nautilia profundicola AmH]